MPEPTGDINATCVELLFTDSAVGQTFARIAGTSRSPECVRRNAANARTAYDAVQRLRLLFRLTAVQNSDLDLSLHDLKTLLVDLGEVF